MVKAKENLHSQIMHLPLYRQVIHSQRELEGYNKEVWSYLTNSNLSELNRVILNLIKAGR